jgi:hypothetical protein
MRLIIRAFLSAAIVVGFLLPALAQDDEKKNQDEKRRAFKRRDDSTDEDLRKQLLLVPEVGFDQSAAALLLTTIQNLAKTPNANLAPDIGSRFYAQRAAQLKRLDLLALPWQTGVDAQLGKETAEKLHVFSINLRNCLRLSVPSNDVRPEPDKLKTLLVGAGPTITIRGIEKPLNWSNAECVPAIAQMMQTENTALRLLMVDLLAKVEGKGAGVVLAQRAIFDLSPQVREKAAEALATRPRKEYQQTLLDGLQWPWQPAADHAAEAIATLKIKEIVPEMVALLKEPDPKVPFAKEGKDKGTYVREIVRINHLSNCLLCHAPSQSSKDLVRGRVPTPGEEMPPLYYAERTGSFVRADITFLRQDFSLVQPVATPGKWPGQQRFDYILRTRKATGAEIKLLQGLRKEGKLTEAYPQREATLFALREVTGEDRGSRSEAWLPLLRAVEPKETPEK